MSRPLPLGLAAPVFAMAPMVTQSDRAFRKLVRAHGCTVCYSEMLMADKFATSEEYRQAAFGAGIEVDDHPLIVQFAANDPDVLLAAALRAQELGVDAIDINLGCPQWKAKVGRYGAWLAADMSAWPLIQSMVSACHASQDLRIPVTCKIRLQSTLEATIEFASLLEKAGCAMLAVHGRQLCSAKHRRTGAADLSSVCAVRKALSIPVLSNGNVKCAADIHTNLSKSKCEGVMVAEQLLRDPALFQRVGSGNAGIASVDLVDEYLSHSLQLDAGCSCEQFTVWDSRNVDVVLNHMRSMLAGAVGKEMAVEPGTVVLFEDATIKANARHLVDWWRMQKASTVAEAAECYKARRDTLLKVIPPLPEGWEEYFDASSNKNYYHRAVTGETTWKRPVPSRKEQLKHVARSSTLKCMAPEDDFVSDMTSPDRLEVASDKLYCIELLSQVVSWLCMMIWWCSQDALRRVGRYQRSRKIVTGKGD